MGKILVSFKRTEKDLYNLVSSQGDKSNFIKDALKFYLSHRHKSAPITAKIEAQKHEIDDILSGL